MGTISWLDGFISIEGWSIQKKIYRAPDSKARFHFDGGVSVLLSEISYR
jgi:hypothetical protein